MTTEMRYGIVVDAATANAELQRVRTEVTTLAGQENALAKATDTATAALTKQGAAAAATSPKVETFQQRVAKLPDLLGKQAAAISLVSSSLEGMGGQVGKAVAGAGQIAAAFGAGGPFAAALVGGIAIVDKLTQYWKDLNDEEERNIRLKYAGVDAATTETQRLQARLVELRRQADPAKAEADDQAKRIEAADLLERQMKGKLVAAMQYGVSKENAEMMRAEASQMRDQLALLREEITLREKIATQRNAPPPAPPSVRRSPPPAAAPEAVGDNAEGTNGTYDLNERLAARRAAKRKQTYAAAEKAAAEEQATHNEIEQRLQDDAAAARDKQRRIEEESDDYSYQVRERRTQEFYGAISGYAQQSASIIAGSSQQLIADLISGQEHALERFGISVMAQAGQALVGYGVQAIGRGVLELSNPLTAALAPVSFAAGGALIGAGVGLGGVAGGLGGLMGADSGGAARGASPRTSTGTTGAQAGPTQITVVYAPSRDEGAAAVALAGKNAERRGLMSTRTR
jgi:hypothetical protein